MGTDIRADVFTESEALAYLATRTGLPGGEGARDLAAKLGRLPLALAQAAAVIDAQRLSYQTYLDRLRAFPIAGYLSRPAEDPYPLTVAAAILLSQQAAQESDVTGMAAPVMDLVSLLSAGGVPRDLLYVTAHAGHLTPAEPPQPAGTGRPSCPVPSATLRSTRLSRAWPTPPCSPSATTDRRSAPTVSPGASSVSSRSATVRSPRPQPPPLHHSMRP